MGEADEQSAVLLVDDDEDVLVFLQRALESPSMRVTIAYDGERALALLAEQRFDVVVSDIVMPGMTGLKLLHAVREHDLDLPVVLVTGSPNLKTATLAVEYGAFQYLIKHLGRRSPAERHRAGGRRGADGALEAPVRARVWQRLILYRRTAQALLQSSSAPCDRCGWPYQPVVTATDGSVYGYEAFLRSQEPLLLLPKAVLKAAEKLRRVHEVGPRRARRRGLGHRVLAEASAFVFVNVHSEDLLDPALYLPSAPLTRVAERVVWSLPTVHLWIR